jgi:putative ABC transport system permease protein
MLSKNYMSLVVIAVLIALPLGQWAMTRWLEEFAYHIEVQWWMMLLVTALVTSIALITISFQTIKAATTNPVNSLRME